MAYATSASQQMRSLEDATAALQLDDTRDGYIPITEWHARPHAVRPANSPSSHHSELLGRQAQYHISTNNQRSHGASYPPPAVADSSPSTLSASRSNSASNRGPVPPVFMQKHRGEPHTSVNSGSHHVASRAVPPSPTSGNNAPRVHTNSSLSAESSVTPTTFSSTRFSRIIDGASRTFGDSSPTESSIVVTTTSPATGSTENVNTFRAFERNSPSSEAWIAPSASRAISSPRHVDGASRVSITNLPSTELPATPPPRILHSVSDPSRVVVVNSPSTEISARGTTSSTTAPNTASSPTTLLTNIQTPTHLVQTPGKRGKWYVVICGRRTGVFDDWWE